MDVGLIAVLSCIFVMVLFSFRDLYKGVMDRKRLRYYAKKSINSWKPLFVAVGGIYTLIFGIYVILAIEKTNEISLSDNWATIVAPSIWTLLLIYLVFKIFSNINKPFIKYSEEELKWRDEELENSRNKAPKWLKWAYKTKGNKVING